MPPAMKKKRGVDLIGKRFGKLTVTAELDHGSINGKHRKWLCVCDCENYAVVLSMHLRHKYNPKDNCGCVDKTPYKAIYNRLVKSAKDRDLSVLSYEDFLGFTKIFECHYCGAAITWTKHFVVTKTRQSRYNLDRKDTTRGHDKGNSVVCCRLCNWTKGNRFTYEQFVQIGKVIRSFRCT